jgi:flavin-dependent dehydrogenase
MEVPLSEDQLEQVPEPPVLRFCEDLSGYGWCFRKGRFLNIGLGQEDACELPKRARDFLDALVAEQLVPKGLATPFRGHAYLLAGRSPRACIGDGILLAGDAAGLADPHSGEGIRPAIESGLLAAATILATDRPYGRAQLEPYRQRLRERFGADAQGAGVPRRALPDWLVRSIANGVLRSPWLTRHLVIDRWFLGRHRPALS